MNIYYLILALAILGFIAYRVYADKQSYQKFKKYKKTTDRQRLFKRWVAESFVLFVGLTIFTVVTTGHAYKNILSYADELQIVHALKSAFAQGGDIISGFIFALGISTVASMYFLLKNKDNKPQTVGDIDALMPRNRDELKLTGLLSINAGIVEELFFRLALPALLFAATGNILISVIVSIIIFGLVHWYQGWTGVIFTMILGGSLMAIYLATGNLLFAIALHIFIDLRTLFIVPYFRIRQINSKH